jgi:hypothetical protein
MEQITDSPRPAASCQTQADWQDWLARALSVFARLRVYSSSGSRVSPQSRFPRSDVGQRFSLISLNLPGSSSPSDSVLACYDHGEKHTQKSVFDQDQPCGLSISHSSSRWCTARPQVKTRVPRHDISATAARVSFSHARTKSSFLFCPPSSQQPGSTRSSSPPRPSPARSPLAREGGASRALSGLAGLCEPIGGVDAVRSQRMGGMRKCNQSRTPETAA